jgi:AcrR family transcriptional regulator
LAVAVVTVPRLQKSTLEGVREKIESAALDMFVHRGYHACTIRNIAVAAGLTPGALYVHYTGKESLFAAVIERYNDRLRGGAGTAIESAIAASSFPLDIPELGRAIGRTVREHRSYWLLWYIDVLEFSGKHFRSQLAPDAVMRHPALSARLEELRAERALRIDPALAFRMVYMHLFNYFLVEAVFGGRRHYGVSDDAALAAISDVFLEGILRPARSDRPRRS